MDLRYPPSPLSQLTLAGLRRRRSEKWRRYPQDVLPLWVAEMDTPLAPPIEEALVEAVRMGDTGYQHPLGLAEAYAGFSAARYGWAPDPGRARLTADLMQGVTAVLSRITEPGDGVVINTPAYPPFFAFLRLAGRRVVESPLAVDEQGRYRLDIDRLAHDFAHTGARAYLLCNPHNPTGLVLSREELLAVAEVAARHRVRVLADEIHAPLMYPGSRHVPYLSLVDEAPDVASAYAFVSASKAWNLPGLKAALAIAGARGVAELLAPPGEAFFGAGLLGVIASEVAFRDGVAWLDELVAGLDANRLLLARLLADALPGVRYRPPAATYLAWLDCRELGLGDNPATAFERYGRVALNPGPTFGEPGRGHARLNFATHPELLAEGVGRMAAAVRSAPAPA